MVYIRSFCLVGCLCLAAVANQAAAAQVESTTDTTTSSSPAAYVYVSFTEKNSSVNEIAGYAAAADGSLTPLPGSPYTADVTTMAVNGKYLFAANKNNVDISAYHIADNGALALWQQTDVARFNYGDCGTSGPLFVDRAGKTLYDMEFDGNQCANNKYESLAIDSANGSLKPIGSSTYTRWLYQAASFTGSNQYAYSVACNGDMYWAIFGEQRTSNGVLTPIKNFQASLPAAKSGDFWCPAQASADPTTHVAMVIQPVNGSTFSADGEARIASFTAAANGNLSTTNTAANMPGTLVGTPLSSSISPDGKLLAVGGSSGLQIFHFHGANAPTKFTNLIKVVEIDQMFWDNQNHLYAISRPTARLFVFTITPTSVTEAPGSPHELNDVHNLTVQTLPLPR
jgi:hypothetical protein